MFWNKERKPTMRIDGAELRLIELPLVAPFTTSFGTQTVRSALIVTLQGDGISGYGECVAMEGPWYSYETVGTAEHIIREYLLPILLGRELNDPNEVWDHFAAVRGHNMAKAALEMAAWDLYARGQGKPLAQVLGGTRDRVAVGVSVGIQASPEALVETVRGYVDAGYRRVKLKIGPGEDVDYVRAVRAAFPSTLLQADANSAYTLADAAIFKAMDDLDLLLIEQPLGPDDIVDHAELQKELITSICLDESIHSPDDARHALDLGSCRIINIKAGRVGGLRRSREIHDICWSRGAPVWSGGMLETNIGRAANVALASLPGFTLPGDISASARYYAHDIAEPNFVLNDDSTLSVPTGPGIGVEIDRSALDRVTLRTEEFSAKSLSVAG
jgi:o-succinylbenzoate synthase